MLKKESRKMELKSYFARNGLNTNKINMNNNAYQPNINDQLISLLKEGI
ncbi:MAG: hypothetical protein ACJAUD_001743 [Crocinitomicaceae bacterium]